MRTVIVSGGTHATIARLGALLGLQPGALVGYACQALAAPASHFGQAVVFVWREDADGVGRPARERLKRLYLAADEVDPGQADGVGAVELDEPTHALVRFAARVFDVTESEVVQRAVHAFSQRGVAEARPPRGAWETVPVYGEYSGQRVDAEYFPASKRMTITSGLLAGTSFSSPSGAARAVVGALNPDRAATDTNGWRFWRISDTKERLEILKPQR